MIALAAAAGGCKSSSWAAKPSWWTFGGSSAGAEKLATASSTDTVPMPSATAQPYPTTSTPEGYALAKEGAAATGSDSAPPAPPLEPGSVTYGSAPVQTSAATAARSAGEATSSNLSSIAPQIGPYAALPAAPASASPSAVASPRGFLDAPTAASASAAPAAFNGSSFASPSGEPGPEPQGTRIADARGTESWVAPPGVEQPAADSRYGGGTGSRFSGGPPPTMPQPAAAPAASGIDAALLPAPPTTLTPPPAAPPAAAAPAPPPSAGPSAIPTRRQDPGYRPGGTSSYRPNRPILAGEPEAAPSAIRPVSFESPSMTDR